MKKERAWVCKYLLHFANFNAGHLFEDDFYRKDLLSVTGFMRSCKLYIKFATASLNWIFRKRQKGLLFGNWCEGNTLKELKRQSCGFFFTKAGLNYFSSILIGTTFFEDFWRQQGTENVFSSCETSMSGNCWNDVRMALRRQVFQTFVRKWKDICSFAKVRLAWSIRKIY